MSASGSGTRTTDDAGQTGSGGDSRPRGSAPSTDRPFAALARFLLPADFLDELGEELLAAHRRRRAAARHRGITDRLRVWASEVGGLFATAWRQRIDRLRGRSERPSWTPTPPEPPRLPNPKELLDAMRKDLVYALRMIVRSPVVSIIAVVSLGVALAANVVIFSVVDSWLLRPLPYPDAERLAYVFETDRDRIDDTLGVAPANYFDWAEQADSFEALHASRYNVMNLTGVDEPEQLLTVQVMPGYFELLGAEPVVGRVFTEAEGRPGNRDVVLLRESLWRNRFGADPDVPGTTVRLDGEPHVVVGVLPEEFSFTVGGVQAWLPRDFRDERDERETHDLTVVGKLRPGVTPEQAEQELATIAARAAREHPRTNEGRGANLVTVRENFPGPTDTTLVQALLVVVLMVLLIACFNVAGLYLAKAEKRQPELAVRMAMGARRFRLLRQLLTESVLVAAAAGTLGVGLAVYGLRYLHEGIPDSIPRLYLPTMSAGVILYGVGLAVVAGMIFGLAPALQALRRDDRSPLLEGSRGGTGTRSRKRMRSALVAAEFALAIAILMGAAVLTDAMGRGLQADPGFHADDLLTVELTLPRHRYPDDASRRAFVQDLGRELESLPGADGWAAMTVMPRARGWRNAPFSLQGEPGDADRQRFVAVNAVSPGFFGTLGVQVDRGRGLEATDRADSVPVLVVNQRFVEVEMEGREALGQRLILDGEPREIVGVVRDIAQSRLHGLEPARPWAYVPLAQEPARQFHLAIRAPGEPRALTPSLKEAVWTIDPDQPLSSLETMRDHMRTEIAGPRFIADLLYTVGMLALVLAAVGIYGLMSFTVARQTREIGIRMALGAQAGQVVGRVARQGLILGGAGLLLGVPVGLLVVRLMDQAMSGLQATVGTGPMFVVGAILVAVGVVACYLPARHATRVDPVTALQEE